jgi:hypothetical protein
MLPNEVTGYVDVLVQMGGDPAGGWLMLETPDGAGMKSDLKLPVSEDEVGRALAGVSSAGNLATQRSSPSNTFDPIRGIGQRLYGALFEGRGQVMYERVRTEAERRGRGVRLVMRCDSPPLETMPWEFLHDGKDFLSLSIRSAIVRLPRRVQQLPVHPLTTVRILIAVGRDIVLDDETRSIEDALKQFAPADVTVLRSATVRQLQDTLSRRSCDFFCYLGAENEFLFNEQALGLLYNTKGEVRLSSEILSKMLAAAPPRLVFLGFSNSDVMARELASVCPSVIGIRGLMDSSAFAVFGRSLFSGLLRGQPLEAAVAQGRQEVDIQNPGTRQWGLPLVYTQAPPESLVVLAQNKAAASDDRPESDRPATSAAHPLDAGRLAQQRKLGSLLTIRRRNLQALKEQAASPGAASPYLDAQIRQTQGDIAKLEQEIDELATGHIG